jgi:hypothetical protein
MRAVVTVLLIICLVCTPVLADDPADDAYVEGDTVTLVWDDKPDTEVDAIGAERVFNILTENSTENDWTGGFNMVAQPDRISLNGSANSDKTYDRYLDSAQISVDGERSEYQAELKSDVRVDLNESSTFFRDIGQDNTRGSMWIRVGPDSIVSEGQARTDAPTTVDPDNFTSITLTESNGYKLEVERRFGSSSDTWNTRADARDHLNSTYRPIATNLDGDAEIIIQSFSHTEDKYDQVNITYTVEYTGVNEGLESRLQQSFEQSENVSVEQADALARAIIEVDINDATVVYDQDENMDSVSYRIDISDYDGVVKEGVDIGESIAQSRANVSDVDPFADRWQSVQESGLVQNLSISASASQGAVVTTNVTYDTQNWQAYVDSVQSRGYDINKVSLDGELTIESDVDGEFSFVLERDGITQDALSEIPDRNLSGVDIERVRADLDIEDQQTTFRVAGVVEDSSDISDIIGVENVTTASHQNNNQYVVVEMDNPTRSDVRDLDRIDQITDIHMNSPPRDPPQPMSELDIRQWSGAPETAGGRGLGFSLTGPVTIAAGGGSVALVGGAVYLFKRRQDRLNWE